jgi:nucleoside-diphosphate-sugar epimerase
VLGKSFVRKLASIHEVHSVSRNPGESNTIIANLSERDFIERLPTEIDAVIHLAQSDRYREGPQGNSDVFDINVQSTYRLLEYARLAGAKKFLFASTGSVYEESNKPHEESEQIPTGRCMNFYAASKYAAETIALSYSNFFEVCIPRFFFLFGPAQNQEMLFPRILNSLRTSKEIDLAGPFGIRINPTPVNLAANAALELTESGFTGVVNIASSQEHTLFEIISSMARKTDTVPILKFHAERHDVLASTAKLSAHTNLNLSFNLDEEISKFIDSN